MLARVAYQGEQGAYGEDAIVQRWGDGAEAIPSRTFDDALDAVEQGSADCAVLPMWNTTVGRVQDAASSRSPARR
jgi:chorismate mutase/prephenate dehydratase